MNYEMNDRCTCIPCAGEGCQCGCQIGAAQSSAGQHCTCAAACRCDAADQGCLCRR